MNKHMKLREKLRWNRGSLRSHSGKLRNCMKLKKTAKMKKWMKIEEEVKGEQGLAALALGTFAEADKN